MINIDNCIELFKNYVSNYDMSNEKIYLKYYHSLRVMNFCEQIAKSLNLSEEEIKISMLIGLLHDIGRFEQIKIYNTFNDAISIDHADYAVKILKQDNYINEYTNDINIQNIILIAIKNHNKYIIESGLDDYNLIFSKIIRDADKLDIFNINIESKILIQHTDTFITEKILDTVLKNESVSSTDAKTQMDYYLRNIGMLFDINYDYSLKYIKNNNIMNKLIDNIIERNMHEQKNLVKIKENIFKYINKKC